MMKEHASVIAKGEAGASSVHQEEKERDQRNLKGGRVMDMHWDVSTEVYLLIIKTLRNKL